MENKKRWEKRIVNCRSCGAKIFFIPYKDKLHPVNENAVKGFAEDSQGQFYFATVYISHFATCPNANQHRKDGGRG